MTLVKKLKQGLGCIRELTAVLEVLVRALDPCKQSDITEDMDSEGIELKPSLTVKLSRIGGRKLVLTDLGM